MIWTCLDLFSLCRSKLLFWPLVDHQKPVLPFFLQIQVGWVAQFLGFRFPIVRTKQIIYHNLAWFTVAVYLFHEREACGQSLQNLSFFDLGIVAPILRSDAYTPKGHCVLEQEAGTVGSNLIHETSLLNCSAHSKAKTGHTIFKNNSLPQQPSTFPLLPSHHKCHEPPDGQRSGQEKQSLSSSSACPTEAELPQSNTETHWNTINIRKISSPNQHIKSSVPVWNQPFTPALVPSCMRIPLPKQGSKIQRWHDLW